MIQNSYLLSDAGFARSRNILPSLERYLSESEAFDLMCNRFHNERGGKGNNIPLDLRKEPDHRVIKPMWKALGSNLNEENACRIAHSLEGLKRILHSVESDCGLNARRRWIWVIWVGPIFFPQTHVTFFSLTYSVRLFFRAGLQAMKYIFYSVGNFFPQVFLCNIFFLSQNQSREY